MTATPSGIRAIASKKASDSSSGAGAERDGGAEVAARAPAQAGTRERPQDQRSEHEPQRHRGRRGRSGRTAAPTARRRAGPSSSTRSRARSQTPGRSASGRRGSVRAPATLPIMARRMTAGHDDLMRAADALAARVPPPLAGLARLAYNYRWSWTPGGHELFSSIDPVRWERCGENPVRLLGETGLEALARAATDADLLERIDRVEAIVRADLERPPAEGPATPERPIAYFCAEFGVHRSLPVYSGGLGALAGDILKESSDRALPLVAVGLMYRQGYFRQRIDAGGWQHEYWVDTDPERLPAALVTGADGAPVTLAVPVRGIEVTAQIWRVDVGRVPLFLLDTERPENDTQRELDHVAALHRRARRAAGAVHPARRRRRARARGDGHRAGAAAPQRGPCRVHLARGRARARRRARRRHRRGQVEDDLHHPHAGPGRQRHLPGRAGRRGARRPDRRRWASTRWRSSGWGAPGPTTTASRSA